MAQCCRVCGAAPSWIGNMLWTCLAWVLWTGFTERGQRF